MALKSIKVLAIIAGWAALAGCATGPGTPGEAPVPNSMYPYYDSAPPYIYSNQNYYRMRNDGALRAAAASRIGGGGGGRR